MLVDVLSDIGNASVVSTVGVYDENFDFDAEGGSCKALFQWSEVPPV